MTPSVSVFMSAGCHKSARILGSNPSRCAPDMHNEQDFPARGRVLHVRSVFSLLTTEDGIERADQETDEIYGAEIPLATMELRTRARVYFWLYAICATAY